MPTLFKDENELPKIWRKPDTRRKLLEELQERCFTKAQLQEFQRVLRAENSDLYDILAYVSFFIPPLSSAAIAPKMHVFTCTNTMLNNRNS